jgi:ubiquinone/menaquinone biosynthesis C-methylase UbiE
MTVQEEGAKPIPPRFKEDRYELLRFLGLKRGHVVAELNCGAGEWTVPAAAIAGDKGEIHAFTESKICLEALEEKIGRWRISNINTYPDDIPPIALNDDTVDFIIFTEDEKGQPSPALITEIIRISKKDGRLCFIAKSPESFDAMSAKLSKCRYVIERKTRPADNCYIFVALPQEAMLSSKVERVAEKLGKELLGLSENAMRRAVFSERLERVKPEVAADILNFLSTKASIKKSPYLEILERCLDIDRLREVLGLEKMSRIYTIAREKGYEDLVRLLMNPAPKGKRHSKYDFVEGRDLMDITLGEKRSLAKGLSKDTLDRLLYDEDPVVIGNLLRNPRLTELEVLKTASRRPVKPEILKVVFESEKWISRYVVKRALVLNPCTPTGIALGLLYFMHQSDLKIISSSGTLHDEIRAGAKELLVKGSKRSG